MATESAIVYLIYHMITFTSIGQLPLEIISINNYISIFNGRTMNIVVSKHAT